MAPLQAATSAGADTMSTTVSGDTPATTNPVKAESKRLLKQVWSAANLEDATNIASRSVELYDGKGLHVLSAANAVASFPGGLRAAVDMLLIEIIPKIVQREGLDNQAFWKSIRRSKGSFARQFKLIDKTLYCMVRVHSDKSYKSGRRMRPSPFEIFDRTTAAWECLLKHVRHNYIKAKYLKASQPRIFPISRANLVWLRRFHVADITAFKVAGHWLPQELVDMVARETYQVGFSAETIKRIFGPLQHSTFFGVHQTAATVALLRAYNNWFWCAEDVETVQGGTTRVGRHALTETANGEWLVNGS
ncbi:hypothetical protein M409DRAFT_21693 [Zasmidium cellare ATCC 36951]|uniref:Uncharacterized protein n=1 Tax=Zasmidium cellare ATCC 36951 TaxID=1080233 RepID=A0A6A6CM78_ZASCE|nr:uncharacterized protein M409DRAFT_21693 [Zasmidium cellare ATCC 36951]KAF2168255.1 hypothetical protein M409DRAFT_21693 [Zasmidium cellare ATCC 36951]